MSGRVPTAVAEEIVPGRQFLQLNANLSSTMKGSRLERETSVSPVLRFCLLSLCSQSLHTGLLVPEVDRGLPSLPRSSVTLFGLGDVVEWVGKA
jgi:hypothetical protein